MEGATPPNLYYEDVDGDLDKLIIRHESKRGLCMLMEGLLDGVAEFSGMEITYEQTRARTGETRAARLRSSSSTRCRPEHGLRTLGAATRARAGEDPRAERIIEDKTRELYLANEKLREQNEGLEVGQARTVELRRPEGCESRNCAKTEFLAQMSHELRTPLHGLTGTIDALSRTTSSSSATT